MGPAGLSPKRIRGTGQRGTTPKKSNQDERPDQADMPDPEEHEL